jgi:hypothetical protein
VIGEGQETERCCAFPRAKKQRSLKACTQIIRINVLVVVVVAVAIVGVLVYLSHDSRSIVQWMLWWVFVCGFSVGCCSGRFCRQKSSHGSL